MGPTLKLRSSRRVAGLKPHDYDHEISLVDNDGTVSPHNGHHYAHMDSIVTAPTPLKSSQAQTTGGGESNVSDPCPASDDNRNTTPGRAEDQETQDTVRQSPSQPSIQVHDATPVQEPERIPRTPRKNIDTRETAIDILYENQRGGFFCSAALFSPRALGGLDPPPWTNEFHKPSLTNIYTAVVPDPTWEWAWPEWRVNHQEGVDKFGWEYSFAFSDVFSWHKAKWWNSFVRRRAWIRRRIKKHCHHKPDEPHLLTSDYFSVRPASEQRGPLRTGSLNSQAPRYYSSGATAAQASSSVNSAAAAAVHHEEDLPDIVDMATLMRQLRFSRIDREKREAVENYLCHARDLVQMHTAMHDIMGLFIFQASRRLLLCHLVAQYNEAAVAAAEDPTATAKKDRKDALNAALKHADEEVRKLAYWSDVKHMVASGESRIGLDDDRHRFYETFQGIDPSGPAPPGNEDGLRGES